MDFKAEKRKSVRDCFSEAYGTHTSHRQDKGWQPGFGDLTGLPQNGG